MALSQCVDDSETLWAVFAINMQVSFPKEYLHSKMACILHAYPLYPKFPSFHALHIEVSDQRRYVSSANNCLLHVFAPSLLKYLDHNLHRGTFTTQHATTNVEPCAVLNVITDHEIRHSLGLRKNVLALAQT